LPEVSYYLMKKDLKKLLTSFLYPIIFIAIIWLIYILGMILDLNFISLGIYPLKLSGLRGILLAPLIHSGIQHLLSNTVPIIILGSCLFYFYRELGLRITLLGWLMSGLWVWVFAREAYHIGASGIIYSWAAFLFVSGVIRRHPGLMALSLLVAFLYGSIIWGIFPLKDFVSWEGHLMGLISGIVLALYFKDVGLQRKKYSWEVDDDADEEDEETDPPPYWMVSQHVHENNKSKAQED
jgi:membrane associated rhomboid family serine protease